MTGTYLLTPHGFSVLFKGVDLLGMGFCASFFLAFLCVIASGRLGCQPLRRAVRCDRGMVDSVALLFYRCGRLLGFEWCPGFESTVIL